MTNHVHLLITAERTDGPAKLMQSLGRRYVQYVNRAYKRSGSLWEEIKGARVGLNLHSR